MVVIARISRTANMTADSASGTWYPAYLVERALTASWGRMHPAYGTRSADRAGPPDHIT